MIGVCFGAFMGVYPGFTAGQFGSRNSSINYAIMFIGFSAAGIAGPMIVSKMLAGNRKLSPGVPAGHGYGGVRSGTFFCISRDGEEKRLINGNRSNCSDLKEA